MCANSQSHACSLEVRSIELIATLSTLLIFTAVPYNLDIQQGHENLVKGKLKLTTPKTGQINAMLICMHFVYHAFVICMIN